jgi:hypothetical protein
MWALAGHLVKYWVLGRLSDGVPGSSAERLKTLTIYHRWHTLVSQALLVNGRLRCGEIAPTSSAAIRKSGLGVIQAGTSRS